MIQRPAVRSREEALLAGMSPVRYKCVKVCFLDMGSATNGSGYHMSSGSSSLVGGPAALCYKCVKVASRHGFSDQRERATTCRAVARRWLAALPPCATSA